MAKILMVIAPEKFRDEELFVPCEVFSEKGHQVEIASSTIGTCKGLLGGKAEAELLFSEADTNNYDAVVFVGGEGSRVYFDDLDALNLAREMYDKKKIVAAICIAPVILASAGLLRDKKSTVFDSEVRTIMRRGAEYTGESVAADGRIVTADGPESAKKFAEKICEMLE